MQVDNNIVTAVGGYWIPDGSNTRVYSGVSRMSWEPWGWGEWQKVEGLRVERSGFMTATVPMSWMQRLCQVKDNDI